MKVLVLPLALGLLAACAQEPADQPAPSTNDSPKAPTVGPDAPQPAAGPVNGRAYRYTSLKDCKLVREEHEEMPYTEVLCAGPGGWSLRIADWDARQTLSAISPQGTETKLDLSRRSGGGFNSFGDTAEWRGAESEPFAPDSLIVRWNVAEQLHPAPETAYLLVVRLAPTPCVAEQVAPGHNQNAAARAVADSKGPCAN